MGSRATVVALGVVVLAAVGAAMWWMSRPGDFSVKKPSPTETVATGTRAAATPTKPVAKREHAARVGTGVVVGSVRVYGKDTPVGDARVTLSSGDAVLETVTQSDGSFAVARVPKADAWTLHVAAAEDVGEAQIAGIVVVERKTTDVGVVYLAPGFAAPGIVEDERGKPVPGAEVSVSEPRPAARGVDFMSILRDLPAPFVAAQTTRSGDDGRFRLTGLPPGSYTVVARKSGLATTVAHSVLVAPSTQAQPIRLVMAKGYRLAGRVVRTGDGPIAALTVAAFGQNDMASILDPGMPGKAMSKTDEKGDFALEGLVAGRWAVIVAPDGEAMGGDDVDVPKASFVEIKLDGGASLSGRVTGDADAPVAGAQVSAFGDKMMAHAQTDADGRYSLRGLRVGSLEMFMVQADGYCPYPSEGMAAMAMRGRDSAIKLTEGANTRDVKLLPGGKVRGVVVENGTTKPVAGATVSVLSPMSMFAGAPVATSGDDGKFEIVGVPIGSASLSVKKTGWCQADAVDMKSLMDGFNSSGREKKTDEQDPGSGPKIVVAKHGDVVERTIGLVRAVALKGRVVAASGEPVAGARVTASTESSDDGFFPAELVDTFGGGRETLLSDADGRFEIASPVAKGKVVLGATAPGRLPAKSATIEIGGASPPGETELRLGAGGAIEGRVTDKDGAPVEGAVVSWAPGAKEAPSGPVDVETSEPLTPDAPRETATSGADGAFRLAVVRPGSVNVTIKAAQRVAAHVNGVAVEEGGTKRVDVTLDPGFSIAGRVSRVDGKPVGANFWVEVHRAVADESQSRVINDNLTMSDDGKFRIECLPAGQYRLTAHSEGAADGEPVVVAAGTDGVELRLGVALSIAGVVRFKDGRPAAGVRVTAIPRTKTPGPRGMPQSRDAAAGPDGTFDVAGLQPGDYDVSASAGFTGGADIRTAIVRNIAAGTAGVAIEVEPGLTIAGRVLGPDGAPVAKGQVTCRPATAPTAAAAGTTETSNAPDMFVDAVRSAAIHDGQFESKGLSPGTYDVGIKAEGFAEQSKKVEAGAKDVIFRLTKGGTIKGRVLGVDGKPVVGASVTIEDEGGDDADAPEVETDADGRFVLEHVAAGVHRVTASHDVGDDTFEGEVKDVRVAEDQTVDGVEIKLKKSE
jgi:uncharacterized GH25 family protein